MNPLCVVTITQALAVLVCSHEKDNLYDIFAIKVADIALGMIVGHLPMENSRVTKVYSRQRSAGISNFDVN